MRNAGSTIFAAVACLSLSCVVAGTALGQQPSRGAGDLVISGTATRGDGSPAAGVRIFIFPARDGNLSWRLGQVGGRFDVANPAATTDDRGRFSISFSETSVTEERTRDFAVGTMDRNSQPWAARPLRDKKNGAVLLLTLDNVLKERGKFDLDKVFSGILVD